MKFIHARFIIFILEDIKSSHSNYIIEGL